eukprot:XP_028350879.1 uncharacterized protein LOC102986935 [Physeter catodon]
MAGAPAPARPRVSSGGGGAASPWAARLPSPGPAACPRRRSARARATAAARPGSPRRRHGGRRAAASASRSARLRAGGRKRFRGEEQRLAWAWAAAETLGPALPVPPSAPFRAPPPRPPRPAPRHRPALCPGSGCATEEGPLPRARAARRRREGPVRGREVARGGVLRGDAGTECFEQEKPGATHFPYEETEVQRHEVLVTDAVVGVLVLRWPAGPLCNHDCTVTGIDGRPKGLRDSCCLFGNALGKELRELSLKNGTLLRLTSLKESSLSLAKLSSLSLLLTKNKNAHLHPQRPGLACTGSPPCVCSPPLDKPASPPAISGMAQWFLPGMKGTSLPEPPLPPMCNPHTVIMPLVCHN